MEMLQLNDLHKTFNPGTVNEKVALNGVSLHMEAGDFATIVGSNGAGKSTLFNAITGGFIADEGSIVLGGQDITFEPEHQRSKVIGHLFQDPLKGTAPNMTIEENLALAYLRAGTAPHAIFSRISRKDKELFREKLSLLDMGLEDRMKQPVGLLSGGQRQALTLLMATLVTPKLLLLDEHTAALPRHGGKGAGADPEHRGRKEDHLPDGHSQHASGAGTGKPHPDDGCGPRCVRRAGRRAQPDDRGRPAGKVPRECRQDAGQRPHPAQQGGSRQLKRNSKCLVWTRNRVRQGAFDTTRKKRDENNDPYPANAGL